MVSMQTAVGTFSSSCRFPIIVILGSTGVGKTKLSIELAKQLNGEVVSADSMQVYKGLDIITAKATVDERRVCKHHMIDIIHPLKSFSVLQYRNKALPIIEDISRRGKLPIIVGGTSYYIEAILWDTLVTEFNASSNNEHENDKNPKRGKESIVEEITDPVDETESLKPSSGYSAYAMEPKDFYEQLKSIDPIAASKVHPNDVRKVKRQLEINQQSGRLSSEIIFEQHSKEGADHLGGPLRFTNALVFWLTCEPNALEKRLCDRVDEMVAKGLVDEISKFYKEYNLVLSKKSSDFVPYMEGIFQAIGFKEFHNYLTKETASDEEKQKLLEMGIQTLKRITIRYSKKQKSWIKNRFLRRPVHSSPNVYELDASSVENWNQTTLKPALKAAKKFLEGECLDLMPLQRMPRDPQENPHRHYICEACGEKLIVGDDIWKKHCQSRKHKKRVAKKRKLIA